MEEVAAFGVIAASYSGRPSSYSNHGCSMSGNLLLVDSIFGSEGVEIAFLNLCFIDL